MRPTLEERLRARLVETADGCLLWTGPLCADGSGVVCNGGRKVFVHRVAWELANGPIPAGTVVRQSCGRRSCAAVEHLYSMSKADLARTVLPNVAANIAKTHCVHGHRLAGENVNQSHGRRCCRVCDREQARRRYWARKAAA